MTVNAYPEDVRAMKRFLCRFDPEGNCLFSRDITEQAGREVSLRGLAMDRHGRLCVSINHRLDHAHVSTTTDMYSHVIKEAEERISDCVAGVILRPAKARLKVVGD